MPAVSRFFSPARLALMPFGLTAAALLCACGSENPASAGDGPRPGCADGDALQQRHATACLCCHADEFSVAGSVARSGPPVARLVVTDQTGRVVEMAPNGFFNFFRHLELSPPLRPVVYSEDGRALAMKEPAPSGDC